MAQAKRISLYLLAVLVLYAIIAAPQRSADFVQLGFEGVSHAAHGVGGFLVHFLG